ncbi:hypothetical protein CEXT_808011 [Caerostris extrusa]|uniref:Uncharacterized protein n=1 Tax=Caerostris extrusa TaxID=172846 RepID=A0AAV4MXN9_CAEEX|nr:hypothetical protein CEXT_808011 [Caerostris extrusa]
MADTGSPAHVLEYLRQGKKKKKKKKRSALNVSKSEMEKQVAGYSIQGSNSEIGSSQSQMANEHEICKYILDDEEKSFLLMRWPPGPCPWLLDLPAKYAATGEDRPLTVDENEIDESISLTGNDRDNEKFLSPLKRHTAKKPRTLNQVPEIPVINSFTPLDQATDMQPDDSPTIQNRMPPVMVTIEDQNTNLNLVIDSS